MNWETIIGLIISHLALIIAAGYCLHKWNKAELKKLKAIQELRKEQEKLRLLKLMHLEKIDENGWTFKYDRETWFIEKIHKNGKGRESVCEIRTGSESKRNYYGYLISNLLNDNNN